ncbi:MAG: NADPH:quinone reductase [Pseudomonadota bacterium]
MRSIWYEATGHARDVLISGDRDKPTVGSGEVLVGVKTSGVNPSDVKTRAGARGPMAFPFCIPHSDGAGVIEEVGPGVDANRLGERVWIWNGAWKRQFGTCAEYISIPHEMAVPLPENTSYEAGACLGVPASTACYGVFADGDIEGQTLLVTGGAGAVGRYAIQFGKWGGAKVIATVSSDEKAEHAKTAGADHIINYKSGDPVRAILDAAGGQHVDRIVEVEFGGNLNASNQVLRSGGVIATYGSTAEPTPTLPFYDMMFNGITLKMYLIYLLKGSQREMVCRRVNEALLSGAVSHKVAEVLPIEETASAHEIVESGRLIGNVIIEI